MSTAKAASWDAPRSARYNGALCDHHSESRPIALRPFFPIKSESVHHRLIVHDKEYRLRARGIAVAMLAPERDRKRVSFFPIEAPIADDGEALSFEDVVN